MWLKLRMMLILMSLKLEQMKAALLAICLIMMLGGSDDPVRMYLREMGSVELLSREGEIAIAKRIEAGREMMIGGICESPLAIRALLTWAEQVCDGVVPLRDIIDLDLTFVRLNGSPIEDNSTGIPSGQSLWLLSMMIIWMRTRTRTMTEQPFSWMMMKRSKPLKVSLATAQDEDDLDDMTLSLAAMESAVYEDVMAQIVVIEKLFKKYVTLQDKKVAAAAKAKTLSASQESDLGK